MSIEELRKRIPTEVEIKIALEHLKKIDWQKTRITSIPKKLIRPLNMIFPIIGPSPKINYLYRTRTFSSFRNRDAIGLTKSYSYLPKSKIKWLGRANLKNDPVFYCALELITAIVETNLHEKVHMIGKWSIKNGFIPNTAIYTETVNNIHVKEWKSKVVENSLSKLSKEEKERLILFSKILELEFLKKVPYDQNYLYKYSAFWSNYLLNHPHQEINAIAYPSVKIANFVNFAIKKSFVDNCLKLEKVYMLTHEKVENKISRILLGVGIINKEKVNWRSPTLDDRIEFRKQDHVNYHPLEMKDEKANR